MKKLTSLILILAALSACVHKNANTIVDSNDSGQTKVLMTKMASEGVEEDTLRGYIWTEADKKRFMKECQQESSENIGKGKLNDFCNCMLIEAQKYYSSYKQMDQKSDEGNDEEIFKKCVGAYGNDLDQ